MGEVLVNNVTTALSSEELGHFMDLARQFTKKQVEPMFEGEFPDGNPDLVGKIIDTAFITGLASSPDKTSAGCEYGIWGCASDTAGLNYSISILSIVGSVCGGVAMMLHAQGVASHIALMGNPAAALGGERLGLCVQEGVSLPHYGTIKSPDLDLPARVTTEARKVPEGYAINGEKSFVWSIPRPDAYVVFARIDGHWGCFVVPAGSDGLIEADVGWRSGLRLCGLRNLKFNNVTVPAGNRIDDGNATALLARAMSLNWVGMSAIAVGIARGALAAAEEYSSQRYQGGTIIENHPAVKLLLGDSESKVAVAEAAVQGISVPCESFDRDFTRAAKTKLAIMELCAKSVTDCMQSMGGYGYMEDFKIEKRLRDVATLKSAGGSPTYLKQLIFDIDREERQ
ncbi:MAG: acyl-CoA dehydrogenase [Spirochaetes bacterium]|nr:acyl-CoA dehydrogenase [Spirochaetota bacterium]